MTRGLWRGKRIHARAAVASSGPAEAEADAFATLPDGAGWIPGAPIVAGTRASGEARAAHPDHRDGGARPGRATSTAAGDGTPGPALLRRQAILRS